MIDRRELLAAGAGAAALAACTNGEGGNAALSDSDRQDLLSGYALNVESWYTDTPFAQRFDAAARAGFSHIEMWAIEPSGRSVGDIRKVATDAGVSVAQIVAGAGELARPDAGPDFMEVCRRAVDNANTLDCPVVTVVGHRSVEGMSKADSLSAYRDHIASAAPIFEEGGVICAIEPFNRFNHPGFFIYGSHDAVAMVREIGSDAVRLNYDLFHMQREEGELIGGLRNHADTIGYVQIADTPDRTQPGTGDVNWANVIRQVRAGGYAGPIGLELWARDGDYAQAVRDIVAMTAEI